MIDSILLTFAAFLIGALPTGYLVGRLYGQDLRNLGSGNIGATNAGRVLGKKAGLVTLVGDIAKGAIAVLLAHLLDPPLSTEPGFLPGILAVSVVFGHCYSPFLRFRGGKGVAAALGAFLTISPTATLCTVVVFVLALFVTRYVSIASITGAIALPILLWARAPIAESHWSFFAAAIVAGVITLRHRTNIARILGKTEPRWRSKSSA